MPVRHIHAIRERHRDAVALIEQHAPSLWVRDYKCLAWRPATITADPPLITDAIMRGLIDNGLVEVHSRGRQGGADVVRPAGDTTSGGAAIRPQLGHLTGHHLRV